MEDPNKSAIYVAPLHIAKAEAPKTKLSSTRPQSHSRLSRLSRHSRQMTPPPTPPEKSDDGQKESYEPTESYEPSAHFHNYLRAFFPFHPECDESSSTVTLPLNVGDIILVHSVHVNGWADGTLLLSGARGWLPTNYCEAFDYQPTRPLMTALTNFWDVVNGSCEGDYTPFTNQDYTRGLVAGVRYLLENTRCLNRESPLVVSHDEIRRNRKALLSYLSILVKSAKRLQQVLLGELPGQTIHDEDLDDMVAKAFKLALRGVKFFGIWNEEMGLDRTVDRSMELRAHMRTPPAETASLVEADSNNSAERHRRPTSILHNSMEQTSMEGAATREQAQANKQPRHRSSRQSTGVPAPSALHLKSSRPASLQTKRTSASYRISHATKAITSSDGSLASERLAAAHDVLLSYLGSFLGVRLASRSATDVLLTIQQALNAGRGLLAVVEAVWQRDCRRSSPLADARDTMYQRILQLVAAARDIFQPTSQSEPEYCDRSQEALLSDAATTCVRGAGECVTISRYILEQIGDFEFETLGLGISAFEEANGIAHRSSVPPQPAQPPPPPPMERTSLAPIVTSLPSDGHSTAAEPSDLTPPSSCLSSHSLLPALPIIASPLVSHDALDPMASHAGATVGPPFRILSYDGADDERSDDPRSESHDAHAVDEAHDVRSDGLATGTSIRTALTSGSVPGSERISSSTFATSPDNSPPLTTQLHQMMQSFSSSQSTLDEEAEEAEARLLQPTHAHELMFNKDGQVTGGSLPALIERLTTHDSTPDALFVATFFLTFRLFTTPCSFTEALIHRFESINTNPWDAGPVRLRVYNVFKNWMESHWRTDCDKPALDMILSFAATSLTIALPAAGKRLTELANKVSNAHGPLVPRLVSSIGKTNTAVGQYIPPDTPMPSPNITKGQLSILRNWKNHGVPLSVLDFDPLELARQLTIKESSIFCSILPEELLATEWTKKSGSMAVNVRTMSTLSTDLANLVADSILHLEDPGKRAKLVKQWIKIAAKCLELNNYDSLMAIVCALDSTHIVRLKRTFELLPNKSRNLLKTLQATVDVSRNYKVLRERLAVAAPPCLPFVGIYLTDLTRIDEGNASTRQLPGASPDAEPVVNFHKHVQTAKIISELQRFQIPYRLSEVELLQTWMQDQFVRVRSSDSNDFQTHYRRSLLLEPRDVQQALAAAGGAAGAGKSSGTESHSRTLGWSGR